MADERRFFLYFIIWSTSGPAMYTHNPRAYMVCICSRMRRTRTRFVTYTNRRRCKRTHAHTRSSLDPMEMGWKNSRECSRVENEFNISFHYKRIIFECSLMKKKTNSKVHYFIIAINLCLESAPLAINIYIFSSYTNMLYHTKHNLFIVIRYIEKFCHPLN